MSKSWVLTYSEKGGIVVATARKLHSTAVEKFPKTQFFLMEDIIMMKLKDLKIDAKATLGRRIVLTNIAPKYVYEGGKKTEKVEGCYYTVFCQDRQYMTLRVSVPGDARIDDATVDKKPHVEFEGLEVHLYYIDKRPIITVTADNVRVAKF